MSALAFNSLYLLVVILALPWVLWRRYSGRRPVAAPVERLTGSIRVASRSRHQHRIWLHGVSVGEVNLLSTLAAEIDREANQRGLAVDCVISSSTTSGLDLARRRFGADHAFPCPLDFSWAVSRVFDRVCPDLLVLGELELWPNMLQIAASRSVPVVIVNGRMSPRSFRGYCRIRPLARAMLQQVRLVLARSPDDAERFQQLGSPAVEPVGSLKFDGVNGDRQDAGVIELQQLAGLDKQTPVFIAGSTQSPEEQLAVDAFLEQRLLHPNLRLILVPRHTERTSTIAVWLEKRLSEPDAEGVDWQLRSKVSASHSNSPPAILLVDVTGELAFWWGLATVAFVGGSLDGTRGGQNMLEPAAYGAAICFGPFTKNFHNEVAQLLADNAAVVVTDGKSLGQFLATCLTNPSLAHGLGNRAREVVERNRGATKMTVHTLLGLLSTDSNRGGCRTASKSR